MAALAANLEDDHGWSGFVRAFAAAAIVLFALGTGFLLAIDPYDSGRGGLLGRPGIQDQYPTTAHASRARNPAFNAAIFGNSRIQQLNPERLDGLTGLSFVSLTMPGTGPADQLAVLRRFLATRRIAPAAVVVGVDAYWCRPALALSERFPAWLYADDFPTYLAGIVRWRSLEAAASRLGFLWTGRGGARPDGYWNYAPDFAALGVANPEASRERVVGSQGTSFPPNPAAAYPAIEALREVVRTAPRETIFVLVRPPVYRNVLPAPGTPEAEAKRECDARIARLAADLPQVRELNLSTPGPIADEPSNFYDSDHYRDHVAEEIERRIAAILPRS